MFRNFPDQRLLRLRRRHLRVLRPQRARRVQPGRGDGPGAAPGVPPRPHGGQPHRGQRGED